MSVGTLGDRRTVSRTVLALLLANVRYWTGIAPLVRREMRRWEQHAQAIPDPMLRTLALAKLRDEGFTAEAAAMLATLAPRSYRKDAVQAIVAIEVMYDYLDGLSEQPSPDPLADGERLFGALISAVAVPGAVPADLLQKPSRCADGYLQELSRAVVLALARLPAAAAITEAAQQIAVRSAQAQIRMHAVPQLGIEQLEQWGTAEAQGTGLGWRELVAGSASSVLAIHALIAAAADASTTSEQAAAIETAYLSTCVLLTLLDGLVDHEQDKSHDRPDQPGYLSLYEDRQELSEVFAQGAQRATRQARELPHGPHHVMTLVGVVAYFTSSPGASGALARPIVAGLHAQLRPLISPTLAIMRTWRLAKRVRNRRSRPIAGLASSTGKSHGGRGCDEI
jgi:tetraprenyl-beta-curcumene synthase